jgi:hypothetical protein
MLNSVLIPDVKITRRTMSSGSGSPEIYSMFFHALSHQETGGGSDSPPSSEATGLNEDQVNQLSQDLITPIDHFFTDSNPFK